MSQAENKPLLLDPRRHEPLRYASMDFTTNFLPKLKKGEGVTLGWAEFKSLMDPIANFADKTGLEYLVAPKTNGYTNNDIAIFLGSERKFISEITDLDDVQGKIFTKINLGLAEILLKNGEGNVNVSLGFNPQEFSEGHHSIQRLHSHIYRITPSFLEKKRQLRSHEELTRFQKLVFVEPFAVVYHDFIKRQLAEIGFSDITFHHTHTSLHFDQVPEPEFLFKMITELYRKLQEEYSVLEKVFTDKQTDSETARFIPLAKEERVKQLEIYLAEHDFLSESARAALQYLAENLKRAKAKSSSRSVTNSSTAWITKGFAGTITLALDKNSRAMRLDWIPRVITTSSIGKTLYGADRPTAIAKSSLPTPAEEIEENQAYYQEIITVLKLLGVLT